MIKQAEAQLARTEAETRVPAEKSENMVRKFNALTAIAGAGFVTAAVLVAQMPELGTIDRRVSAAVAGLAPMA